MCCHVTSSLLNHCRTKLINFNQLCFRNLFFFFLMFDFGPGQGLQKDHVGGRRDVNIRDFVVVHARSTLQSPRSPWTSRRPHCVVHYRRGPRRDFGDRGRRGKAHARPSQSPFFTKKTRTILFSSRVGNLLVQYYDKIKYKILNERYIKYHRKFINV
jgi:hypothetical protein